MSAISTETLSLGYGETVIIDELDVAIPKGEITVLIGSNGAENRRFYVHWPG